MVGLSPLEVLRRILTQIVNCHLGGYSVASWFAVCWEVLLSPGYQMPVYLLQNALWESWLWLHYLASQCQHHIFMVSVRPLPRQIHHNTLECYCTSFALAFSKLFHCAKLPQCIIQPMAYPLTFVLSVNSATQRWEQ